jgi:tRNA/rRNA methyltransferase/tRNA (cytidine32/uridine32-2'-O)-methyltransferase
VLVLIAVQDLVNLASCIRLAKNFQVSGVRLVAPECEVDPWRIEGVAHNTGDLLDTMTVHERLDDALADITYVQALTGRERTAKRTVLRPRPAAAELVRRAEAGPVAILAGREDKGLSNEELDRCDALVTISANPEYNSLNLAQAVGIGLYESWLARGGDALPLKAPRREAEPATHAQLEALFADWERSLNAIEFFKTRQPELVLRGFRELIYRAAPDGRETALLRAIGLEIRHYLRRRGLDVEPALPPPDPPDPGGKPRSG